MTTRSTWTTMSPRARPCSRSARNCGNELRRRPPAPATLILQYQDAASIDLGPPTDAVRRALADRVRAIVAVDPVASQLARERLAVVADEEALPFRDASLDLVVSALALQFVNDLPGTLIQIRRTLRPDGLLLAALAGGDTLTELRQAYATAEAEIEGGISPRV